MAARLYLVLVFVFAVAFQQGGAIKCWHCSSTRDVKCGTQFDNSTLVLYDCNNELHPNAGIQPKLCSKMTIEENGRTIIQRSCAYTEGYCPDATGSGICSTCSTDGCNGAGLPTSSVVSLALCLGSFVLLARR